jgi:hypothetical protein
MSLADQLYKQAFDRPRDPRSEAYRLGVLDMLRHHFDHKTIHARYLSGQAEHDAWLSGMDEGRELVRRHRSSQESCA